MLRISKTGYYICLGARRKSTTTAASLAAGYQPKQVEAGNWQDCQEQRNTQKCTRGKFHMILPPPNVTGQLHLGHALMATIQDVICRQRRQIGYDVVWVPGTDHAGIATQVVVEKKLLKERGLSRHQLGREAFLDEVWKWKREKGGGIVEDLRKLGCTLTWDREYFTMDKQRAHAVDTAFIQLFEEGLIKRQKSLVNWSCALESAISDIEVESLELKGPTELAVPGYERNIQFGRIYDIGYRLCDSNEEIVVSTTRPETVLGDVAIAVHPTDERYMKYRDQPTVQLQHPFRKDSIPLIFDIAVEREFGTGAVKVTPAHDRNDFDMAQRHLLAALPVFDEKGRIVDQFEQFAGLPRFDARERVLEALGGLQLLRGIRDHNMVLPVCSRSRDVIEYMLRSQWFLHCQPMAEAAAAEVRSGRLQIVPPHFETEWHRWLDNCRDWCISRQLWWGHQIPAYKADDGAGNSCWVAAHNEAEALAKATLQLQTSNVRLQRDSDVLDTWFSSALLPMSAFNWPSPDYQAHYPLDLMETGHDILFFWVARMAMLGIKFTGKAPFKKLLLNGIICDAAGRKMSKSLGNVITPKQVIDGATLPSLQQELQASHQNGILSAGELRKSLQGLKKMLPGGIQECGTDALRFTLCSHNIKSHFINFDVTECYANKLFLNKIWQATRFTLGAADRLQMPLLEIESMNGVALTKWDSWILSQLADTLRTYAKAFEAYNLHVATAALKQFLYANLCDVYLETTKANISAGNASGYVHCATLATCLSWALQALSPFTPAIVAQLLPHLPQQVQLNLDAFPAKSLEAEIAAVLEVCQCVRRLKSLHQISKKHDPRVQLYAETAEAAETLKDHLAEIQVLTLTNGVALQLKDGSATKLQEQHLFYSTAGHLYSFGLTVNDAYKQASKSASSGGSLALNAKKLQRLESELERYRVRVDSEGFRQAASAAVQQNHWEKIKQLETEISNIKSLAVR